MDPSDPINPADAASNETTSTTQAGVWPPPPDTDEARRAAEANQAARQRLYNIAVAQRDVIWAILVAAVAMCIGATHVIAAFAGVIVFYGAAIYEIIAIYKLAKAFENLTPILYAIACLIPCLSLLALLSLSQKATTELTRNGIKVGLLGANPKAILP